MQFYYVDDEVRLEDDWMPMDQQLNPAELEEVIKPKGAHSRAVVLESVSIIIVSVLHL